MRSSSFSNQLQFDDEEVGRGVRAGAMIKFVKWFVFWLLVATISIMGLYMKIQTDFSSVAKPSDPQYPESGLDVGIYWFGDGITKQKGVGDVSQNDYFDENKPKILLYVHGWQPGSVSQKYRECFNNERNDPEYGLDFDEAQAWLDDGWNVGLFYWNQLGDEADVEVAETKVWQGPAGPKGMRWLQNDLVYTEVGSPNVTVPELVVEAYFAELLSSANQTWSEIRVVGHSLGNQVVLRAVELISEAAQRNNQTELKVSRVALVDPFYSLGGKDYLGGSTPGEHCVSIMQRIRDDFDVVVENHKSSLITSFPWADENVQMQELTAFVFRWADYPPFFDFSARHANARDSYFMQYADHAPVVYSEEGYTKQQWFVPHSRLGLEDTRALMGTNACKFQQVEGLETMATYDDTFQSYRYGTDGLTVQMLWLFGAVLFCYSISSFLVNRGRQEDHLGSDSLDHRYFVPAMHHHVISCTLIVLLFFSMLAWQGVYVRSLLVLGLAAAYHVRTLLFLRSLRGLSFKNEYIAHVHPQLYHSSSTGVCIEVGGTLTRVLFNWIRLLPIALLVSAPANASSTIDHEEREWIPGVRMTLLGMIAFVAGFILDTISDLHKKQSFHARTLSDVMGSHDDAFSNDNYTPLREMTEDDTFAPAQREEDEEGTSAAFVHTGIWRHWDFPHILSYLLCAWGLYIVSLDGYVGASYWMYIAVVSSAMLTVTGVVICYHMPESYIQQHNRSALDGDLFRSMTFTDDEEDDQSVRTSDKGCSSMRRIVKFVTLNKAILFLLGVTLVLVMVSTFHL